MLQGPWVDWRFDSSIVGTFQQLSTSNMTAMLLLFVIVTSIVGQMLSCWMKKPSHFINIEVVVIKLTALCWACQVTSCGIYLHFASISLWLVWAMYLFLSWRAMQAEQASSRMEKKHAQISDLTKNMLTSWHSKHILIWWRLLYWTQWYHFLSITITVD